jgi:DNA-binding winged helix-turn-helix (wHTH) protein
MAGGSTRELDRIGELILDVDAHLLTRAGELLVLPPKTFELLHELVRRAPGVVRRQELMDTVWPQEIVNEEALTQRVMLLRRALGDDPQDPKYIASVPRWGYRFVAEVRPERASTAVASEPGSRFVVTHGDRLIPLPDGETVIGREPEAGVSIDSLHISRRHARIVVSSGCAVLEDLGSKNGTYLNGQRITAPVELTEGDEIGVGHDLLVFRFRDRMGTTLTGPP